MNGFSFFFKPTTFFQGQQFSNSPAHSYSPHLFHIRHISLEGLYRGPPFVWAEIREIVQSVSFTRKQRTFITFNPLINTFLETKRDI